MRIPLPKSVREPPQGRKRPRRLGLFSHTPLSVPLLGVLLIALLWGVVLKRLDDERKNVFDQTISSARLLVSSLDEHTIRALHQVDQLTLFIKYEFELDPDRFDLKRMIERGIVPDPDMVQVAIIDHTGHLVSTSIPGATLGMDLSDREHFRYHMARDTDRLYVSKPVLGRASGQWTLQLTRRLDLPDGSFGGVVVISVSPRYFTNDFYNGGIFENDDMIAVIAEDGTVMSRRTSTLAPAVKPASSSGVYPPFVRATGITTDPVDGIRRFYAYQHVEGFPLAVVVGLSETAALQSFHHTRTIYLLLTALISLAVITFVTVTTNLIGRLTERERAMTRLAEYDPLTGLPNRWRMMMLLRERLARQAAGSFAVLLIDLDNFKVVNDTLGQHAGDDVLAAVASRLRQRVEELGLQSETTLGRVAGDGYMVLVDGERCDETASRLASALGETIRERPFEIEGISFDLHASIGIALHTQEDENEQDILRKCDVAMYAVKSEGKGRFQFYEPERGLHSQRLIEWEQMLRDALSEKQFFLEYQPKINLRTRQVTGFEALLRWRHPRMGLIPVSQFVPIAETLGWIVPIGEYVLVTAARQLAEWHAAGHSRLGVSVNVSSLQFWRGDLVETARQALETHRIPPGSLEIEVTETATMKNAEMALQKMSALKALGLHIALDDFGTGHSSLAYLRTFPIDTVKIDKIFVKALPDDDKAAALVRSILNMAESMRMDVVVEGIENTAQADWLASAQGASHVEIDMQGFLYSASVSASAVPEVLARFPGV